MAYSALLALVFIGMVINPVMAESQIPEALVMTNQGPIQMGNYQVHFSAFNSMFIPLVVAEKYNLRRNACYGIVNIAIRDVSTDDLGVAVGGMVSGYAMNLLAQRSSLKFSEVKEGNAIYYLADFKFSNEELLKFVVDVKPQRSSQSETLRFEQTFYQ